MNIDKIKKSFDEIVLSSNQDLIQENANTDGKSPMGMMGLFASETAKEYAMDLLSDDVREAFNKGAIHIHDFDYYATGTTTCCQIPLGEILNNGFRVGECEMRKPKTIMSAMALASILIQSNQNQQHGGQSYPNWDYDLAPYAKASYERNYKKLNELLPELTEVQLDKMAYTQTEEETFQACEAFIHNANSMLSRNGMQVPFVSINFGLDTSRFGRMISMQTLKAQEAGLGDGSTPIFPILVYKMKKGINFEADEPNYDIYREALVCQSKRLFPNFQFVDTPFNIEGFDIEDPNTHIATMGCRTRIFNDVNGKNSPVGRGNLSFTTLNLPFIAMESSDVKQFFENLDKYSELVTKQLLERLAYQKNRRVYSFKMLYTQGVWKCETPHDLNEIVGDMLDTGSLSLGYVGLAEALMLLTGKHHGESEESQKLGLEIVSFLRGKMDEKTDEYKLNFSLLATPAESYCGKACLKFIDTFGKIDGVTDYEYFTNSNHVPVWYDITIADKVRIEAPYHELTNGGHISYVELDGAAAKNVDSIDDVVKLMAQYNIGYGSINHPVDRCLECGKSGVFDVSCDYCDSTEISRIRRITGYLVGAMDKWNKAKVKEESLRVKHSKN